MTAPPGLDDHGPGDASSGVLPPVLRSWCVHGALQSNSNTISTVAMKTGTCEGRPDHCSVLVLTECQVSNRGSYVRIACARFGAVLRGSEEISGGPAQSGLRGNQKWRWHLACCSERRPLTASHLPDLRVDLIRRAQRRHHCSLTVFCV
jgi:hypothetical protein